MHEWYEAVILLVVAIFVPQPNSGSQNDIKTPRARNQNLEDWLYGGDRFALALEVIDRSLVAQTLQQRS
jgi:hypothetical protein